MKEESVSLPKLTLITESLILMKSKLENAHGNWILITSCEFAAVLTADSWNCDRCNQSKLLIYIHQMALSNTKVF